MMPLHRCTSLWMSRNPSSIRGAACSFDSSSSSAQAAIVANGLLISCMTPAVSLPKHRSEDVGDRRQEGVLIGTQRAGRGENEGTELTMRRVEANDDEAWSVGRGIRQLRTEQRGAGDRAANARLAAKLSFAA